MMHDADKLLNLRTIFSQIKMMRILASHFVNQIILFPREIVSRHLELGAVEPVNVDSVAR